MSQPNAVLAEPLTLGQEQIHRGTCGGKIVLVIPFLIGLTLAVFFSPVLHGEVETPAIDMQGASCLKPPSVSVNARSIQKGLRTLGIQGPVERFALTAYAGARDEAKAEYAKLDPETQAKLTRLGREVVVRATKAKKKSVAKKAVKKSVRAPSPYDDVAGVTGPLGFWDPAGFTKEGDIAQYRRAELKHGRVCMTAALGLLVSEAYHPIFDNWNEGPWVSGVASHFSPTASQNFWPAFWIMAAGHELATSLPDDYEGKDVLDYGFDPLKLKPEDPEKLLELQNKELNNGRLAMVGAAGIIAQELVTGKSILSF
jgi:hypothetical protein